MLKRRELQSRKGKPCLCSLNRLATLSTEPDRLDEAYARFFGFFVGHAEYDRRFNAAVACLADPSSYYIRVVKTLRRRPRCFASSQTIQHQLLGNKCIKIQIYIIVII